MMRPGLRSLAVFYLVLAVVSGCTLNQHRLGKGNVTSTKAETRVLTANEVGIGSIHGQVVPRQIVCAEPSPDVAVAFAKAFGASGSFAGSAKGANIPADMDAKTAFALSSSRAESLAQMTNRLATIQLLRDGLYRACEAYQNGAISDTTYAVLLSRFDKAMVTMLMGELVAGNFGQTLAALGTSANGSASANPQALLAADDAVDKARQKVTAAKAAQDVANKALNELADDATADARKEKEKALVDADTALASANEGLLNAIELKESIAVAATSSATGTPTPVGAVTHDPNTTAEKRADVLGTMQRKYIENLNVDPIIVACITALDRRPQPMYRDGKWYVPEENPTALTQMCAGRLADLFKQGQETLSHLLDEGRVREAGVDALKKDVKAVSELMEAAATLKDQPGGKTKTGGEAKTGGKKKAASAPPPPAEGK